VISIFSFIGVGKYELLTFAAVGFSNVTAADCFPPCSVVVERLLILPQNEKKSRTSFSDVLSEMPVTWTVVGLEAMFVICDAQAVILVIWDGSDV